MAFEALGVDYLGGAQQQPHLACHQPQPGGWIGADERQRAIGPVARHLRRCQTSAEGVLGERGGVESLVLRRPTTRTQRHVAAIGTLVVADEQVRTKLRGREIKPAADRVVPHGDRQQDHRKTRGEQDRRGIAYALFPLTHHGPDDNARNQCDRVLSREAQRAHRDAEQQPPSRVVPGRHNASDQRQCNTDKERIENRLLNQAVEEDCRRVEGQHQAGHDPGVTRDELRRSVAQRAARYRAQHSLNDADDEKVPAEDGIEEAEKVRIERGLIEHLAPEPLASRNLQGPLVVAARVSHQDREIQRVAHLPDMQETNGERREEDRNRSLQPRVGAEGPGIPAARHGLVSRHS